MIFSYELWIAYRYLKARRQESFISVVSWFSLIGIAIGVATLIIVMSVMNGFREEMLKRIIGFNGHASLFINENSKIINLININKILSDNEEVINVIPVVESTIMVSAGQRSKGVFAKGFSLNDFKGNELLFSSISSNTFANFANDNSVIIGHKLFKYLNLKEGSKITLISPTGLNTPFGSAPLAKKFNIAGTFDLGMYEYDSSVLFMSINNLRDFIGYTDNKVDHIEIFYDNPDNSDLYSYNIKKKLDSLEPGNIVVPWTSRHKQLSSALEVERTVMFIILTLIIIVAAFNIISSMIMLVRDKESSISILRTIGVTDKSILKIFVIVGSSIGFIGTTFGLIIGLLFSINIEKIQKLLEGLTGNNLFSAEIYFLSNLPSKIILSEVVFVVLLAFILSLSATIYPAWKASKIDPIKVLRHA
ncbi:MAG: Lipoprotein-releasing system transmembrane protein LolE [Alphaproteobacteria bacterium MarineAlpha9_Bin3]|nr:MAG: Lipoprotein-releasing system transmembrane protein LolE [Alphaproteobacteria bacterium MarineAlpha9_Bin3]